MEQTIDASKILDLIAIQYPNAVKCKDGHKGESIITTELEEEWDGDRYYEVKVSRCSVCNMPDGGEDE